MTRQTLEEVGFVNANAEMVKLDLCLGPSKSDGALEGRRVMVFIGQIEHFAPRGCDQCPERDSRRSTWCKPDASTKTEDRIENGTRSVVFQWSVDHRDWCTDSASP